MSASGSELRPARVAAFDDELDERPPPRTWDCDACGRAFEGTPGGSGLLVWTRGDDVRYEEPPLCEECASEITIGALIKWELDEEEES
jgi:hypothetical protein